MTNERRRMEGGEQREGEGSRRAARRRAGEVWRGATARVSSVIGEILGAAWPAPSPVALPVPVRTTRPMRAR
jgi:hypothetical protein